MKPILTEQDIVNTYDKRQREQSRLYLEYKRIKKENPEFGYKRISKILGQPYHKTRGWHSKKYVPVPIQTVEWLKKKDLIPLKEEDKRLTLISKILGTTFGDGGIFGNLNGIFISSSELDSVKEFEEDIKTIFGKDIEKNSRIIEGGVYGHSWSYQNTNRNIIRFFQSLGSPIGKKSNIELIIPSWIYTNQKILDSFFSSFFGNEIGIPKIHNDGKRTNSLDLGMVFKKGLKQNRMNFLKQIQEYLSSKGTLSDSIYTRQHKEDKDSLLTKLTINLNFDNLMNFYKNIEISYSKQKRRKLEKTLNELKEIKLQRFKKLSSTLNKLTNRNYSEEWIRKNLRLTDKSLKFILDKQPLEKWN